MSESDTDDDLVQPIHHLHAYPHGKTAHSQISNVNKTRYKPYNNIMASNFNMPTGVLNFDPRCMQFPKEKSPLRRFPDSRMQYQQPYSHTALSSHNSGYNAQYRAPASETNLLSMTAADIKMAIKNGVRKEHELRFLMDFMKKRIKEINQNKIEKRRNLKSFKKQCRKNSDDELGAEASESSMSSDDELGAEASESSMSSDDCRSTRSAFYSHNIPKNQARSLGMDSKRLTTQTIQIAAYKGTENFKHVNHSFMTHNNQKIAYDNKNLEAPGPHQDHCNDTQNAPTVLKHRLAKDTSALRPIQRFNMSSVNKSYKITYTVKTRTAPLKETIKHVNLETDSDDSDEIFTQSMSTVNLTNSNLHQKRVLEDENVNYPESKRTVNQSKRASTKNKKKIIAKPKKFKFMKSLFPLSRSRTLPRNKKHKIKSSQPLIGNVYTDEDIFDVRQKDKKSTKQVTKEPYKVHVLAKALPKDQIAAASTSKVALQKITGTSGVIGNNTEQIGKQDMRTETDEEDTVNLSSQETSQRHQMPGLSQFSKNGDSVVANARSTIVRSTQNIRNPNVNKGNDTENTRRPKGKMHDKLHENKENDNDRFRIKVVSKKKEANVKTDMKILKST